MVLGKIRGFCEFLLLLTVDSVHLSARKLQTHLCPYPPVTELQVVGSVKGLKKELEEEKQ